jgi:hypothetical protein
LVGTVEFVVVFEVLVVFVPKVGAFCLLKEALVLVHMADRRLIFLLCSF